MIITCPHCQTRYQVAREAIGAVGRKVQCAHCMQAWQADPVEGENSSGRDEKMFDEMAEQQLDAVHEAEARAVALAEQVIANAHHNRGGVVPLPPPPPSKPVDRAERALQNKRMKAFSRRQTSISRSLPMARMRRAARIAALVTLVGLAGGFFLFKTEIVRQYPDFAGVYESLGIRVNVVGLDFRDVTTLRSLRAGEDVLTISARIASSSGSRVTVPPAIVTLLDSEGKALYEWSVAPAASSLDPGEVMPFETQLSSPPENAASVRLTFAGARAQARAVVEGH